VALWIEEHRPTGWALVTAVDPRYSGLPLLEQSAVSSRIGELLRDTFMRRLTAPLGVSLVALGILGSVPEPMRLRVVAPRAGDVLAGRRGAPLEAYVATVRPPAYASLAEQTIEQPTTISALEGSTISIAGHGGRVLCGMARGRCRSEQVENGWRVLLVMPDSGAILTLGADSARRLIALVPRRDSLPVVLLRTPDRDTVLRLPEGTIPLVADLRDDFGIVSARFEYVISAGIGETYTFRSGIIEAQMEVGQGMRGQVDIRGLGMGPGDVMHVRAVAQDAGPARRGLGVSATRAIRVARERDYDTTSSVVLPGLPADTSALSQRLLIQLAEELLERAPRLARATVVEESRSIGRDQARLRRLVADVIFQRLGEDVEGEHAHGEDEDAAGGLSPEEMLAAAEAAAQITDEALDFHGDESPVVAVNRPLLEAYNAMWDAGRELNIGEPTAALPHMYRALDAIQRARAAERVYLRGRPTVAVLDVDAIRLVGDRRDADPVARGGAETRSGRDVLDRFLRAIGRTDSLLVLRIQLLDTHPEAAVALGEAIEAMRVGADHRVALSRARAMLAGAPVPASGRWEGW
jgi:hypothetical protein